MGTEVDEKMSKQIKMQLSDSGSSGSSPTINNDSSSSKPVANAASIALFESTQNLSSFPPLKSTDPTTFSTWKSKFKNFCLMTGISKVVFNTKDKSLTEAVQYMKSYCPGCSEDLIRMKYKELHSRAFGALALAIEPAVDPAIVNEIEAEQGKQPDQFIDQNANVLWTKLTDHGMERNQSMLLYPYSNN